MYSKILLVYILLVLDSINSESIFDENTLGKKKVLDDVIPYHLKGYNYYLICKLQPNGFDCDKDYKRRSKFYYDMTMKTCMTFWHGNCDFSLNKFNTLSECNHKCMDSWQQETNLIKNMTNNMICRLQPEFGNCQKYIPMFYFDISTRHCRGFSYSGCGGNGNKFLTERMCLEVCPDAVSIPNRALKIRDGHDQQWDIEGRR